jgi:hypothetical protein
LELSDSQVDAWSFYDDEGCKACGHGEEGAVKVFGHYKRGAKVGRDGAIMAFATAFIV